MTAEITPVQNCRLCDSARLDLALSLPPSPIGDAFVPSQERDIPQPEYPLDLRLCRECGHVQLGHTLDPERLFREYLFETRSSLGLVEHFRRYRDHLLTRFPAQVGELVVEIGSNDGSLLKFFQESGLRVLGIDPARRPAETAQKLGIPTLPEFFTSDLAESILREHGSVKIVAANNVFAHAEGLRDIATGVRRLLSQDGLFVFEVSYLLDIVEKLLFDTIYHEHLSYHSIKPLVQFLQAAGLELIDVERIPTKGGSIRCFAQRSGGPHTVSPSVAPLLATEQTSGLDQLATFQTMSHRIDQLREEIHQQLEPYLDGNQTIVGYGASPTATTLMYAFQLQHRLAYLVDDNPLKQGLLSPGAHLPVYPSPELAVRQPALAVILAWNYAESILKRNERYLSQGGHFLIPMPTVKIVS